VGVIAEMLAAHCGPQLKPTALAVLNTIGNSRVATERRNTRRNGCRVTDNSDGLKGGGDPTGQDALLPDSQVVLNGKSQKGEDETTVVCEP
jgi:hypothetical protein